MFKRAMNVGGREGLQAINLYGNISFRGKPIHKCKESKIPEVYSLLEDSFYNSFTGTESNKRYTSTIKHNKLYTISTTYCLRVYPRNFDPDMRMMLDNFDLRLF